MIDIMKVVLIIVQSFVKLLRVVLVLHMIATIKFVILLKELYMPNLIKQVHMQMNILKIFLNSVSVIPSIFSILEGKQNCLPLGIFPESNLLLINFLSQKFVLILIFS